MSDLWDPFLGFPFTGGALSVPGETASFVDTCIDWKETPEAHVFQADLPGVKKEEVKWRLRKQRFCRSVEIGGLMM